MKKMIWTLVITTFLVSGCTSIQSNTHTTPSKSSASHEESRPSKSLDTISTYATGAALLVALLALNKFLLEKCDTSSNVSC